MRNTTAGSAEQAPHKGGSYLWAVDVPQGFVNRSILKQATQLIDSRLRGLGVTNWTVYLDGDNIVIGVPDKRNSAQVLDVVAQTAELFFRPVECQIAPYLAGVTTTSTPAKKVTSTTKPPPGKSTGRPKTTTSSYVCGLSAQAQEDYMPPHSDQYGLTPAEYDNRDATVVLPFYADFTNGKYSLDDRFVLGPAEMTGSIVSSATAVVDTSTHEWEVDLSFTSSGATQSNDYAAQFYKCYKEDPSNPPDAQACPPTGAMQAIELDATVYSNPAIEASSFPGGATINGSTADPFTGTEATDLANALNYGTLPVRFMVRSITSTRPTSALTQQRS